MDITRFLLKQETKDKLQEETRNSAGELRWNKLKELEKDGSLATAKTRWDIVKMLGYDQKNISVYQWVSDKIRKHYLVEQVSDTYGEYQYYTSGTNPNYDLKDHAEKMREAKKKREQARVQKTSRKRASSISYQAVRVSRLDAIKQLQDSGKIAKIATRRELSEAIKVPYDKSKGWFSNMITSGFITEANQDETPRYSLTQKAIKEISKPTKTVKANPQPKSVILKPIARPATKTDIAFATEAFATEQSGLTMTIHYGDLTIEFKGITQETINSLVNNLADKANQQ